VIGRFAAPFVKSSTADVVYHTPMKARQLEKLGFPAGAAAKMAKWLAAEARKAGLDHHQIKARLAQLAATPEALREDPIFGELARQLDQLRQQEAGLRNGYRERPEPAPWRQWGADLDAQSLQQMRNACRLPVSLRGALMPDAHVGYGLPIGGVLATDNAVIPYAVGVDIACRMKLSILDLPADTLEKQPDRLRRAIEEETVFGVGAEFRRRRAHEVIDEDWGVSPITGHYKDKAHAQLGTSGSGNHFVEFGTLTLERADLGLEPGVYLALLSHSGSRGTGALVAEHYSRLARRLHPELPKELSYLAWLDLDRHEGQEYFAAMELMGRYAAANHAVIHRHIVRHLGARVLAGVENHHNFAWVEEHEVPGPTPGSTERRRVIVHRKGATPAGKGVLGMIPGSMAAPGYVVRGKGSEESLQSAAHGAGRVMSRTKALATYRWAAVRDYLEHRGVTVISAGLDEVPFVYKDIDQVMAQQSDLVEAVARFDPKLVKMAPGGERAED
jgi:tRNA-splicing ligase RtcB